MDRFHRSEECGLCDDLEHTLSDRRSELAEGFACGDALLCDLLKEVKQLIEGAESFAANTKANCFAKSNVLLSRLKAKARAQAAEEVAITAAKTTLDTSARPVHDLVELLLGDLPNLKQLLSERLCGGDDIARDGR